MLLGLSQDTVSPICIGAGSMTSVDGFATGLRPDASRFRDDYILFFVFFVS